MLIMSKSNFDKLVESANEKQKKFCLPEKYKNWIMCKKPNWFKMIWQRFTKTGFYSLPVVCERIKYGQKNNNGK